MNRTEMIKALLNAGADNSVCFFVTLYISINEFQIVDN